MTASTPSNARGLGRSALNAVRALSFAAVLAVGVGAASASFADPENAPALQAYNTHQYQQAVDLTTKTLAAKDNIEALYIRGNAYNAMGNFAAAITDFEKAKTLTAAAGGGPMLMAINNSLITSYMFGGQTDKGVAAYHEMKAKNPTDTRPDDTLVQGFQSQANNAVRAGKIPDAIAALERAATEVPAKAGPLYAIAAYYMSTAQGADWKKVQAEAGKALAVDPNNARANFVMGVALANSNDTPGAIAALQKAKANAGSDANLARDVDAALTQLQPAAAPAPKG